MIAPLYFRGNYLLEALPTADKLRIYPQLEAIRLPLGRVLYDGGWDKNMLSFRRERWFPCNT
jgi:hypothetical protein